jgi:hypothetical protein
MSELPASGAKGFQGACFDLHRDALAFANETLWRYLLDEKTGKQITEWRDPKPDYTLRCFPLVRVAKQFHLHARFAPDEPRRDLRGATELTVRILKRNSRASRPSEDPVVVPGFSGLREFSAEYERMFKGVVGGPWLSYVQRGNWRMVFPIWRGHQERVMEELRSGLATGAPRALHVFQFPRLGVNHAVLAYDLVETKTSLRFLAYDPNTPDAPLTLLFDKDKRGFQMPATHYFIGGPVNVYSVYRNWLY